VIPGVDSELSEGWDLGRLLCLPLRLFFDVPLRRAKLSSGGGSGSLVVVLGWDGTVVLNMGGGRVLIAVTDEELLTTSDWPGGFNPHYIRSRSFEDP
jgi:hypothetical protein